MKGNTQKKEQTTSTTFTTNDGIVFCHRQHPINVFLVKKLKGSLGVKKVNFFYQKERKTEGKTQSLCTAALIFG